MSGADCLRSVDRSRDVLGRHNGAVMHVGDHPDAQSVERRRQAAHQHVACDALDVVTLVHDAVSAHARDCADRDRGGRPKKVPARHAHAPSIYSWESGRIRDQGSGSGITMTLFEELEWRGMVAESTEGVREALATRARHCLHRFRSDCVEPAHRQPAHGHGPGAPPEIRPHTDCHRRWRHRHDRRSQAASRRSAISCRRSRSRST